MPTNAVVERISAGDMRELATEHAGARAQVAAVLVLGGGAGTDLARVRDAIGERIRAVPRLRQRLIRAPFGGGRPVWVDDPGFDIRHHVTAVGCPAPGDETALLGVAAGIVTGRLPADRPLWSVTLVPALADGDAALIMTLHHVVADGIGGLAVLANLVDGVRPVPGPDVEGVRPVPGPDLHGVHPVPGPGFPRPAPSRRALFRDAAGTRLRALTHLAGAVRRLRPAIAELTRGTAGPPRCSLNQPTGAQRRLAVARADLAAVRRVAHAHGATVNDVVLTAVSGALYEVVRHREENVNRFVLSVPISARRAATATGLGNQLGILTVPVIVAGDPYQRLSAIARTTRDRKPAASSESAALLGLAFRALARLGVMRWFVDRQRLVTTFVTNLRGPDARLSFLGAPITDVIPVSSTSGNVTVAFAVLSYAGTLVITVVADPRHCPDLPVLVTHLQKELDRFTAR